MEEERERENFVVRLMTISFFHVLFISLVFWVFFLKVKRKEGKDLRFLRPPSDRSSPSLPLPRSLCPSPPRLPQSILDHQCQL